MTNETSTATETATVAEQGANVAPESASSTKGASSKKSAKKGAKGAKAAKPAATKKPAAKTAKPAASKKAAKKEAEPASKKAAKPTDGQPREGSKKQIVLDLLRRKEGATLAEIAKATEWQSHSIRGFISGALGKKMGLTIESSKNDAGVRIYRIAK